MALALERDPRVEVAVVLDERVAAFMALGIARATGRATAVLCTSGTAAAEYTPAVVEAHLSAVPLLVLTADRAVELRDVGAPQAIDQVHLFGRAVRWFADPGAIESTAGAQGWWRSFAARALLATRVGTHGPVHLNLPFREPLVGEPGELTPGRPDERPWHDMEPDGADTKSDIEIVTAATPRKTLVVAGESAGSPALAAALVAAGAVVVADPLSGWRGTPGVVCSADDIVRDGRPELVPDEIVRLGGSVASRRLPEWCAQSGALLTVVDPSGRFGDHLRVADHFSLRGPIGLGEQSELTREWAALWARCEFEAQARHDRRTDEWCEESITRRLLDWCSVDGVELFVSSSMPIRHAEWCGGNVAAVVRANRGANGIDGVIATAGGVALGRGSAARSVALVGDLALRHDLGGLMAAVELGLDLGIVVLDNGGGGIFSRLPQRAALDPTLFERLFTTPSTLDTRRLVSGVCDHVAAWDRWVDVDYAWLVGGGVRVAVVTISGRDG